VAIAKEKETEGGHLFWVQALKKIPKIITAALGTPPPDPSGLCLLTVQQSPDPAWLLR